MPYIKCEDLNVGYTEPLLLRPLNFTVNPGDYLIIVGENGAGKSTLMKTILHLLTPYSGKIEYGDGLRASGIGYLPQQTIVQRDFPASVREVVLSGCQSRLGKSPFYSQREKSLAEENINKMGIAPLSRRSYRTLSGGQQQRVLLARALCATEKLLLMDEPVAGLDPAAMSEMYQLIRTLNREGVTIIMISHDVHVAVQYASHILHVSDTPFWGTTQEYLRTDIGKYFVAAGQDSTSPDSSQDSAIHSTPGKEESRS